MPDITCASCGATMPADTKFCVECGAKVVKAPEPAPVPVAPAPAQTYQAPAPPPPTPITPAVAPQPYMPPPVAPPDVAPATPEKPIGTIGYFLTLLLFAIPIVGIVVAFLWALGKKTGKSRKSLAIAQLILWGICLVGILVWYILNFSAANDLFKEIIEVIKIYMS